MCIFMGNCSQLFKLLSYICLSIVATTDAGLSIGSSSHRVGNVEKTFRLGQGIVISSKVSLSLN